MTPVLRIEDLAIRAPGGAALLTGFSTELAPGGRLALLGRSGAGKTTVLRAILDELPAGFTREGSIRLGADRSEPGSPRYRRAVAGTVAYLPQDAGASLTPTMRIGALLAEAMPRGTRDRRARATEALGAVGLPGDGAFLRRRPWQLSGGQQRRVALARAVVRERPLLVLDEPTAGLDPDSRRQVLAILEGLSTELRSAILLVTHDAEAATALDCARTHLGGDPGHSAPPREVRTEPRPSGTPAALAVLDATVAAPDGTLVVAETSWALQAGQISLLHGPSGVGKSTLARALAGLAPMRSGTIELHGVPIAQPLRHRTRAQRRAVQIVHQSAHDAFNPRRTIAQSLADARGSLGPDAPLDRLHLDRGLLDRRPHELSGGQRQRLALLRALTVEPTVLLLDEPTTALDTPTAHAALTLVRDVADRGAAVLLLTHDIEVSEPYADRTLTLTGSSLRARSPR